MPKWLKTKNELMREPHKMSTNQVSSISWCLVIFVCMHSLVSVPVNSWIVKCGHSLNYLENSKKLWAVKKKIVEDIILLQEGSLAQNLSSASFWAIFTSTKTNFTERPM